ncbi:MAG: NACHT domain-containing protein [Leptolyngbya sp. SIO1E4]|nr:NACHT domain-containing protein [Leptolyngbya sp. SIO1E4]
MSEPRSFSKKRTLVRTLNGLPPPKFEELRYLLNAPQSVLPGDAAPQGSRGVALLEWAESPVGCGLSKLEQVLEEIVTVPVDAVTQQSQTIRTKLLRRLQGDIELRLKNSLRHLVKIDLQMEEQRQRVGQPQLELIPEDTQPPAESAYSPVNRVFRPLGVPEISEAKLEPTQSLLTVMERRDVQGKLLILGEPGSGKTTELVALAYDLLTQAEQDEREPLPIVFELSAWEAGTSIEQWLIEQIQAIYKVPPKISQQWLQDEWVIPLLDGLDELGLENHRKCVVAINKFLEDQAYPYTVVCCRREEYEKGQVDLFQLEGALYIQPLTPGQMQDYLRDLNRFSLWENIEASPELLDLSRQPLFLTMLVVAYQGRPIRNEAELFNAYIEKQLSDPRFQGAYPPQQAPSQPKTLHYLNWLAQQMEKAGKTEYLIEEMQPSWLSPVRQRLYRLIVWLIVGLIVGLMGGLIFGLSGEPIVGLIVGLMGALIVWLNGGSDRTIEPSDRLIWSMRNGLIFGLIFGLIGALIFGLIFGLSGGLMGGLMGGLIVGLMGGLERVNLEEKNFPNQGIRKSLHTSLAIILSVGLIGGLIFGLIGGLSVGLSVGLIGGLIGGLSVGLSVGLIFGLIVGLSVGLSAVIKHYMLRLLLAREGSFPWDCVRFLDHAAQHRFIQRVGGRYRFMHDLLRKHFATGELPSFPSR